MVSRGHKARHGAAGRHGEQTGVHTVCFRSSAACVSGGASTSSPTPSVTEAGWGLSFYSERDIRIHT